MNAWGVRHEPIHILQWGSREESLRLLRNHQGYKHIAAWCWNSKATSTRRRNWSNGGPAWPPGSVPLAAASVAMAGRNRAG